MHIRRGDFKDTFGTTTRDRSPAEAIAVLEQNFSRDDTLVILTDEREDSFFMDLTAHYRNSLFIDIHILENYRTEFFELPYHDSIALAYLSQLVGAESAGFVGSMTSTFTSLIQRYRGNRGLNEQFKFLWNEIPAPEDPATERGSHAKSECVPLHSDGRMVETHDGPFSWNRVSQLLAPSWQREWPESILTRPMPDEEPSSSESPNRSSDLPTHLNLDSEPDRSSVFHPDTTPQIVEVSVCLSDGHVCRTELPSDSELLHELFAALAMSSAGVGPRKLIHLPVEGGHGSVCFSSDRIVAIETNPPVLLDTFELDSPVANAETPPHTTSEWIRPPRRSRPIVREVPNEVAEVNGHAISEGPPSVCAGRRVPHAKRTSGTA